MTRSSAIETQVQNQAKPHLVIVDDDRDMCDLVAGALSPHGFDVSSAGNIEDGMRELTTHDTQLLLADLNLGDEDGLELCRKALTVDPDLPVIVLTAFGSMDAAVKAIQVGVYDFVTKPVEMSALRLTVDRAIKHGTLTREVKQLRRVARVHTGLEGVVGASPAMRTIFELVERVSESDANVLIQGESGTGKEVIASAIHQRSKREGPFVAINCSAVPEQLLESELFGHTRGAFTDAKTARPGLFTEADGGTLFLDEIGEMPLSMQPKLLRALEERVVRPVGSTKEIPFDARIIAATNKDLESEVEEGRFREDLFYRINVVRLDLPPLRARGNDVLALAQHFLESAADKTGREVKGLVSAAAARLLSYPFPGNVRELENAMERAVALTRFDQITVDDLPPKIREHASKAPFVPSNDPADLPSLAEVEERYIRQVLEATRGNKTQTAKVLGVDRRTLYRKLKRLDNGNN